MNPEQSGHSGREPIPAPDPGLDRRSLLEAIRAWVEVRRRDTPLRDLATEIGIGKSSVDKLVRERSVPHKNLPKLTRWFLRDRHERYGSLPAPADMAVLALEFLANVPAHERPDALRRTAAFLGALHDDKRAPRPEWLAALHALADQLEAPPEAPPRPGSDG